MTDAKDSATSKSADHVIKAEEQNEYDRNRLAPFNPTCEEAQVIALEVLFCNSRQEEVLFDLGCGDGRFLLTAARRLESIRCVGVERDPVLVERAISELDRQDDDKLKARIHVRLGDVMDELTPSVDATASKTPGVARDNFSGCGPTRLSSDFQLSGASSCSNDNDAGATSIVNLILWEDATAVFVYLLPSGFRKIHNLLEQLMMHRRRQRQQGKNKTKPILRIVSYMFTIPGWHPRHVDRRAKGGVPLYMYDEETYDRDRQLKYND